MSDFFMPSNLSCPALQDVALESQSLQQILDAVRELRQEGGWDSEVRLPGQDYCTPSPSPIKTPGRS